MKKLNPSDILQAAYDQVAQDELLMKAVMRTLWNAELYIKTHVVGQQRGYAHAQCSEVVQ